MQNTLKDGFADRLKTSAEARQALLAKFKPKAANPAPEPIDRAAERRSALEEVREARSRAKSEKLEAAAALLAASAQAAADEEAAELETKRSHRRVRKALSAAEAKAKRDARYAARQARR